jgi:hypothetical protein
MVNECLQVLKTPMLSRFIGRLRAGDRAQASAVLARVRKEVGDGSPHSWAFECDVLQPGMFFAFFQRIGEPFRIHQLLADPTNPGVRMRVTPLMLEREGRTELLPLEDTTLKPGDRILFAGDDVARRLQQRYLTEPAPSRGYARAASLRVDSSSDGGSSAAGQRKPIGDMQVTWTGIRGSGCSRHRAVVDESESSRACQRLHGLEVADSLARSSPLRRASNDALLSLVKRPP